MSSQTMVSIVSVNPWSKNAMKPAALAQTAKKPDCFRQAIGYMQQRCTDLDKLEEDKISCKIHAGYTHTSRLMKVSSCDFHDPVRTGHCSSLSSDGVSLSQAKSHRYSSR